MHPPQMTGLSPQEGGEPGLLSIGQSADQGSARSFPWVTLAVAGLLVAVHGVLAALGPVDVDALVRWGAKAGPLVLEAGQVWRLLSANLLHRDALHLALNVTVLVAAGTALERACRRVDYVALLISTALTTMASSLAWSGAVSVGASGLVYGCMGALLVLGRRHRSRSGFRVRWLSGESSIPTVLVFLWLGWTSVGVDNAGHLGGLVAGLLTGAFLEPRESERSVRSGVVRPLVGVGAALLVAALVVMERSGWRVERDDGFGVAVALPEGWRGEVDGQGRRTFSNGLPGLGRATFSAEAIEAGEAVDGLAQARHFHEETLPLGVPGPEGRTLSVQGPSRTLVGGRVAQRLRAQLEGPDGGRHLLAFFVPRGEWVYRLVFTWPAQWPAYQDVVGRMVAELRFDEPSVLREARGRALLSPGAPGPQRELGAVLRRLGLSREAVTPLAEAVRLSPAHVGARVELARALLDTGRVEEGCHAADEAQVYGPSDTGALEAGVRCELARGALPRALERLEEARRVDPQDARLRAAEAALRTVLEASPSSVHQETSGPTPR
ncbi:rhomboid family intramembrane serine protease [Myxococcus qinghaiensis]|uniref:rhomboid family intramembrane serine protease n=1 Tax=Myxococcus qinghaiensis TaxID=2906758 RepID=UPI0020A79972|nr:rhomboid family intramembrane serine protease [Myxococcus qinghaiensis]MCP3162586.1 rhomboid family intramembrane serine protease [Myxococcus qinghaiensis]